MATKVFIRETTTNGIGSYRDLLTTAGSSATTGVVDTVASGTNIQWTKTAGGSVLEWISKPVDAFTLAGTITFSFWVQESHAAANSKGRARVYKYSGGSEVEITGSPWDEASEFPTSNTERTWTGSPTSTAFATGDRIVFKLFITNAGTMGGNRTCTVTYDAADTTTGDSFVSFTETITFLEPLTASASDSNASNWNDTLLRGHGSLFTDSITFSDAQALSHGLIFSDNALNFDDTLEFSLYQLVDVNDSLNNWSDTQDRLLTWDILIFDSLLNLNDSLLLSQGLLLSDSLNLSDDKSLLLSYLISNIEDSLNSFQDILILSYGLSLVENLSNWNEFIDSYLEEIISSTPLTESLTDSLNNWNDTPQSLSNWLVESGDSLTLSDSHSLLLIHLLEFIDTFTLNDALETFGENLLVISDSLESWQDFAEVYNAEGTPLLVAVGSSLYLFDDYQEFFSSLYQPVADSLNNWDSTLSSKRTMISFRLDSEYYRRYLNDMDTPT